MTFPLLAGEGLLPVSVVPSVPHVEARDAWQEVSRRSRRAPVASRKAWEQLQERRSVCGIVGAVVVPYASVFRGHVPQQSRSLKTLGRCTWSQCSDLTSRVRGELPPSLSANTGAVCSEDCRAAGDRGSWRPARALPMTHGDQAGPVLNPLRLHPHLLHRKGLASLPALEESPSPKCHHVQLSLLPGYRKKQIKAKGRVLMAWDSLRVQAHQLLCGWGPPGLVQRLSQPNTEQKEGWFLGVSSATGAPGPASASPVRHLESWRRGKGSSQSTGFVLSHDADSPCHCIQALVLESSGLAPTCRGYCPQLDYVCLFLFNFNLKGRVGASAVA